MKATESFTGLYPLDKTLRFELKPEPETLQRFETWLQEDSLVDREDNLFLKDKKIAEAYIVLKPILDKLHEEFINESLSSIVESPIDFRAYWETYREDKKSISNESEKELRTSIGTSFLFMVE